MQALLEHHIMILLPADILDQIYII
uniref:Uncharacterized protein n=1 Tax=Rhizophora mucronata TaxID=61149 RepID=A0A2P2N8A0_RHIMU